MTAARLLRLYPRGWRDRYGDEFVAMFGDAPLRFSQTMDIISGAIDARLSSEVRTVTGAAAVSPGGTTVIQALRQSCFAKRPKLTTRDHVITGAIVVGGSLLMSILGIALHRNGYPAAGEFFKTFAFPASLVLSGHASDMKHRSWKVQVVVLEGMLVLLAAVCWIATKI